MGNKAKFFVLCEIENENICNQNSWVNRSKLFLFLTETLTGLAAFLNISQFSAAILKRQFLFYFLLLLLMIKESYREGSLFEIVSENVQKIRNAANTRLKSESLFSYHVYIVKNFTSNIATTIRWGTFSPFFGALFEPYFCYRLNYDWVID